MSIWAEPSTVPQISPLKPNVRPNMSNYNFDAIQSVPFDASTNDMEQILSSISVSTSSKSDEDFPITTTGLESTRMSTLLKKLGSYFSHPHKAALMSQTPTVAVGIDPRTIDSCTVFESCGVTEPSLPTTVTVTTVAPPVTAAKRHGSLSSNSDNSSISANSAQQLCSSVVSGDKRIIDQCDEMVVRPTVTAAALCNDSGESFTLPRVNLKQR